MTITNNSPEAQTIKTFDIRNFIERLEPAKEKGKYKCPVCEHGNLSIKEATGEYKCFNGCKCQDIREAIKPWDEVVAERKGQNSSSKKIIPTQSKKSTPKHQPAPIPEGELTLVKIAVPSDIPVPQNPQYAPNSVNNALKEKGASVEELKLKTVTIYSYDANKNVYRYECPCANSDKGRVKTFSQSHVDSEGNTIFKKGNEKWPAYRIDEVIENCKGIKVPVILPQEGEGCVEIARGIGLVSFTFQGSNWSREAVIPELKKVFDQAPNTVVAFLRDPDDTGEKKSKLISDSCNEVGLAFIEINPRNIYPDLPLKGDIKEVLAVMDEKEFIRRLEEEIHAAVQEKNQSVKDKLEAETTEQKPKPKNIPPADIMARELLEDYIGKYKWNNEHKTWVEYEKVVPFEKVKLGIWTPIDDHTIECSIQNKLEANGIEGYGSDSYIQNICKFLSRKLSVFKWTERENVLPFEDGIVHIATGKFEKHCPENLLTWCLPRSYNDKNVLADWNTIRTWLSEISEGNEKTFKTLTHFAAAVLRGRYDLQKVLYLWGDGGSGKGTYTRLLEAIIGAINCWSGKIEWLDDPNQVARLLNKKLAIFADQDKVSGKLQSFKNLTGGDKLVGKHLYKDPFEFYFTGLGLITANFAALQGGGIGRWFERRVIAVKMNLVPEKVKNLDAEFAPEISAFTRYLLSISDEEINAVLRDEITSKTTDPNFWEMATRQDSLASWVEQHIIFDVNARTQIGSNKNEYLGDNYNPATATLFGSYHRYCYQGGLQGKGINNFSPDLEEILRKVLRHPEVQRVKTRDGAFFVGVRLRTEKDDIPTISEVILKCDDPCDDPVMGNVMTSKPCSDRCDDLLNEKKILNNEVEQVEDFDSPPNVNSNSEQTKGKGHHSQSQQGSGGRHTLQPQKPPTKNQPNNIDKQASTEALEEKAKALASLIESEAGVDAIEQLLYSWELMEQKKVEAKLSVQNSAKLRKLLGD